MRSDYGIILIALRYLRDTAEEILDDPLVQSVLRATTPERPAKHRIALARLNAEIACRVYDEMGL